MSGPHPINITPNNNEVVFNNVNNHITITNNVDHNVVEIIQPVTTVIEINTGIVGPQGSSVVATSGSFTGSFTGSLNGTSSWSNNSLTASYYGGSVISSSYAATSSNSYSSSFALTASYVANASSFPFTGSALISGSLIVTGSIIGDFTGSLQGTSSYSLTSSYATTASYVANASSFPYTGSALITGSLGVTGSFSVKGSDATSANYALKVDNSALSPLLYVRNDGLINISGSLIVSGSITGSITNAISSSYALTASYVANASSFPFTGSAIITGSLILTGSATFTQNLTASRAYISASSGMDSGPALRIYGSGSTNPVFTVQGSQGELFSITDSLSGSLFSVNDISGLPVLEAFSDNTILMGDYQAPSLNTTKKTTINVGVTTIISISTGSYDGLFVDYTARSGSNARAGQMMGIWSGSSVNYTETTTTDFGSTSALTFGMSISGSNLILSGSSTTAGWTVKSIIRSI